MRLLFLIGSGSSLPAPMPGVQDIDSAVRKCRELTHDDDRFRSDGREFSWHSSDSFCPWTFTDKDDEERMRGKVAATCSGITNIIWRLVEEGFGDGWPATTCNYETVYSILAMLADDLQNVRNPVVWPMLQRVKAETLREFPTLFSGIPGAHAQPVVENFAWWLRKTCAYIEDVVHCSIRSASEKAKVDHLAVFSDAADNTEFETVDFVTTNHDTLLEKRFAGAATRRGLYKGFRSISNELSEWTPDSRRERNPSSESHLLKLHGSTDWWTDTWAGHSRIICPHPSPTSTSVEVYVNDSRPLILTGTVSKMIRYSAGIFIDHLNEFVRIAHEADHIVCCGYGFGDARLNRIIDERAGAPGRALRLTIAHRDPDDLQRRAENASAHKLLSTKGIQWVEKWVGVGDDALTLHDLG